ncbi:carboxypeptidase-like regulatory domain-containing protein [Oceanithermus profundus]
MHAFHPPHRRLWRGVWLLVLLFAVAGCGSTRPPANVIGHLGPAGGWLEGPDGLAVSLVEGAIETSIAVVLESAPQPTLPLPTGVQPVGDAYRIAADRDVPASEPFVLVVPLPEGADPTGLALAVYHPGGAPHAPDPMWFRIPGTPTTELGAFLVQLPSLPQEGLVFLPVRDGAAELPAAADGGVRPAGGLGSAWLPRGKAIVTPKGAFNSTAVAAFESAMNEILNLYRRSKLRPPLLQVVGAKPIVQGRGTPVRMDYTNASYGFYMMPSGTGACGANVLGFYDPRARIMVVCAPTDGSMSALMKRTLIHEIFHAVQGRYGRSAFWWAESTAALSENSIQDAAFQPLLTPDYSARSDWIPLPYFGRKAHYRSQDFWYHVLRERGLAFDAAMDAYMRHPMTVAGANDALGGKLADEYWHWFKDQTYVKGAATARPAPGCRPDPNTAINVAQLNANTTSEAFVDHSYKRYVFSGAVFRYKLPNTEPFPVTWRLWFTISGDPLTPNDRNAVDTQAWSCSWQTGPVEIRVPPGQTLESGALAANVDLGAAADDEATLVGGGKPYRLHAKPLRGKVALDGPTGGLSVTVTELSTLGSMSFALTETSPGSGTYLIGLPVGRYDIRASGGGGYTATYRNVAVQEGATVTPAPENPPGREVVFLGRSSGGPLNLYLWDLDRGTVRALTSFADDTWADPATQAVSFAAVRTAAGDLVAVMLQDPGSSGTEVLYRLSLADAQAVPVANLPGSYQLSYVNLSFQEGGTLPAALRYFDDTLGTQQLQMIDLQTGEVVWTADVSGYATQCSWRPGRSVWAGGYLLGCGNMNPDSSWTALVAAVPSPLGGYQGTLARNPAFMQFEGPADFGGIEFGNSMIFVERALYPDFSEATGFVVDANTTTSTFVALPGETPYGCSPAPKLMQVACLRTGGVVVHTVDGTGAVTQTESFALPGGYTIDTGQLDAIDFVEPLER